MKLGVVGLPNVGKSTLFNAITHAGAECANYPFCTIEPNVGIVALNDKRLDVLAGLYNSKKVTPAVLKFVDIAGLVKGASKGEGLGNKFLSHIREVDAVVHVVRCFQDKNITHVSDKINPLDDMEVINTELCLADLETASKHLDKTRSLFKTGDKKYVAEAETLEKVVNALQKGEAVRNLKLTSEENELIAPLCLITRKPMIYCANIAENDIGGENPFVKEVSERAKAENVGLLVLSAKIEEEIAMLPAAEQELFFKELGLMESGLDRLTAECYKLLGLISYLTAGEKETRAWTIEKGTKAPQAAGKIHTDFEKGFIRAEVVPYEILVECGNYNSAKEKGKVRSEGRDYEIKDGDVVLFRFNV